MNFKTHIVLKKEHVPLDNWSMVKEYLDSVEDEVMDYFYDLVLDKYPDLDEDQIDIDFSINENIVEDGNEYELNTNDDSDEDLFDPRPLSFTFEFNVKKYDDIEDEDGEVIQTVNLPEVKIANNGVEFCNIIDEAVIFYSNQLKQVLELEDDDFELF